MATRARRQQDQPVHPRFGRLCRVAGTGDVVKHNAAIGVHRVHHMVVRAEGGDDQRHTAPHHHLQIILQPRVRRRDDEVDAIGGIIRPQRGLDLVDPCLKAFRRALVERREGADRAGLARGDHQRRVGNEQHGGHNYR